MPLIKVTLFFCEGKYPEWMAEMVSGWQVL
jgi:hypothetical protein